MYPGAYAEKNPDRAAVIMAGSGATLTYQEFEARANRLAHCLRAEGLAALDHYAIFMENNLEYMETCAAGERTGLYYTCVNSYLTAPELAYIVSNSESQVLITSKAKLAVAIEAVNSCPDLRLVLVTGVEADDLPGDARFKSYDAVMALQPDTPIADEQLGTSMVVIMERFDPEHYLTLIEQYRVSHSQLVPTMFSRMLKLPEEVRLKADLSSLETAVHAAAPCPVMVKQQMIDWWGPIIHEYYGATEGLGFAACDSAEWLAHPGTVGKVVLGELSVLDDEMNPLPMGEPGTLWFKTATEFQYHRDQEKTKEATSEDGSMTTVGDVGYVDSDGFLYLTDRKTFMIISGGVNIYPQETEDLLISHPKVVDAAVFGVPNVDLGEEVKAVVQAVEGVAGDEALTEELLAYLGERVSRQKIPRSIDYRDELPRLPTGKLYKRLLRDEYWGEGTSRIV
jgi:long-chain acyl-CoA synthetase